MELGGYWEVRCCSRVLAFSAVRQAIFCTWFHDSFQSGESETCPVLSTWLTLYNWHNWPFNVSIQCLPFDWISYFWIELWGNDFWSLSAQLDLWQQLRKSRRRLALFPLASWSFLSLPYFILVSWGLYLESVKNRIRFFKLSGKPCWTWFSFKAAQKLGLDLG